MMSTRSAVLLLAAAVVALTGLSTCSARNAASFAREKQATRDSLLAERADNQRLAQLVVATERRADSAAARASEASAKARTHANRAAAYATRLDRLEATLADTATVVPRPWFEDARAAADELATALAEETRAHATTKATVADVRATLDSVTAKLARSAPRIQIVERFVAKAEPPCRWLLFPCLSRTQTAVVSIAGTVIALHYGDAIVNAVSDGLRRIR